MRKPHPVIVTSAKTPSARRDRWLSGREWNSRSEEIYFYPTEEVWSYSSTCDWTLTIDLSGNKDLPKYLTHPIDLQ